MPKKKKPTAAEAFLATHCPDALAASSYREARRAIRGADPKVRRRCLEAARAMLSPTTEPAPEPAPAD